MNSKFLTMLTNSDNQALVRRAESINTRAKMTQENLISSIKLEIENKKLHYQDLTDMGPDQNTSLTPSASNWDPAKWVNEIQETKQGIYELEIQLKLAMETYLDLFGDTSTDKKSVGVKK